MERILLVEDSYESRAVYRTILEHLGYEVLEALDGAEGVRRAREDQPDLVLMDLSIPLLDGWDATRILRSDPLTAHIPVIALSAHTLPADRARAAEAGCDDYLTKPVDAKCFAAAVQRCLSRAMEPHGPTVGARASLP